MKKLTLTAAALCLGLAAPASASIVTLVFVPDGVTDTRPCLFFQVDNIMNNYYAVLFSDLNYGDEDKAVTMSWVSHHAGTNDIPIYFGTGNPVSFCSGFHQAFVATLLQ
jgi:hypothetical protein